MRRRVHIEVRGRVQGVGYRQAAKVEAERLGLSGFVRNLPDGTTVEMEVEGSEEAIREFLRWALRGPKRAEVASLSERTLAPTGQVGFEIRRDISAGPGEAAR